MQFVGYCLCDIFSVLPVLSSEWILCSKLRLAQIASDGDVLLNPHICSKLLMVVVLSATVVVVATTITTTTTPVIDTLEHFFLTHSDAAVLS
jgi:hypothetical protein